MTGGQKHDLKGKISLDQANLSGSTAHFLYTPVKMPQSPSKAPLAKKLPAGGCRQPAFISFALPMVFQA
jgi:hypothetical protein